MAIFVRHKFVSQKEDGPDNSVVRPSNWNDTHTIEMAGSRIVGRAVAGGGEAQEIPLGNGLVFDAGSLAARLGAGLEFDNGMIKVIANILNGLIPVGVIVAYTGNQVPAGWVRANGQTLLRSAFPALWSFAQNSGNLAASMAARDVGQYGPGDGSSNFVVPHLEQAGGIFIRPIVGGRAIGSYQQHSIASHTHGASMGGAGAHAHTYRRGADGYGDSGHGSYTGTGGDYATSGVGDHTHPLTIHAAGSEETRPNNVAYPYIIKAT